MFRKPEDAFHVQLISHDLPQLQFSQGELLPKLVALAFVGGSVNGLLVEERVINAVQAAPNIARHAFQAAP